MIEAAEANGDLQPEPRSSRPTSNASGLAALVAAVKGYRLVLVMPGIHVGRAAPTVLAYGATT